MKIAKLKSNYRVQQQAAVDEAKAEVIAQIEKETGSDGWRELSSAPNKVTWSDDARRVTLSVVGHVDVTFDASRQSWELYANGAASKHKSLAAALCAAEKKDADNHASAEVGL